MNCTEAARWIDALLDGELDPKNDAEVREHLEDMPDVRNWVWPY